MMIKEFNTIRLKDIYGKEFSMEQLKGHKVYLTFLRTASCPFCNLRVHQLIQKQEAWTKKGIVTVAVFASAADEILQYAGKQEPKFTIIADPEERLYHQFGIKHSFLAMIKSMARIGAIVETMKKGFFNVNSFTDKRILTGDFLINENQEVVLSYYGKDFGDHIDFEEIDQW